MESVEEPARHLADAIDAALPGWVVRSVTRVMSAWTGTAAGTAAGTGTDNAELPPDVVAAAEAAARQATDETGALTRALLLLDIDEQRTTPLTLIRGAVRYPTAVLKAAGVPPVERDRFAIAAFPDDDYDLTPASFADVDPALAEPGIAWGAAKAFEHKRRHRSA
jgi:hypothetical protein